MYQFKAKDSEIKGYALCLCYISKDFTIDHMNKKRIKIVKFSKNDTNDVLDIHKYLMKRT